MTALTSGHIRVEETFKVENLLGFRLESRLNEHAYAYIRGIVPADVGALDIDERLNGRPVKITAEGKVLFCGLVKEVLLKNENSYFSLEAWLVSGSYLLDLIPQSRSFQNIDLTYEQVIGLVLEDTADCLTTQQNMLGWAVRSFHLPLMHTKICTEP